LVGHINIKISVLGDTCQNPEVTSTYYTNTDEKLIKDTVFIVEFDVKCRNKLEVT